MSHAGSIGVRKPDLVIAHEQTFVSLGADCQPAHHIKRLFPSAMPRFFDWIYSSPSAVRALIVGRFQGILDPATTEWEEHAEGVRLVDRRYGLKFDHQIVERNDETVARLQQLYSRMGRLFLEVLEDEAPACFVRRVHPWDGSLAVGLTRDLARYVLDMKPNSVFLTLREKEDPRPEVMGRYIEALNWNFFEDWKGSDQLYEENFKVASHVLGSVVETRMQGH